MNAMAYSIDQRVFDLAPDYCRVVLRIRGAGNFGPCSQLERKFQDLIRQTARLNPGLRSSGRFEAWRGLYNSLGLPVRVRSSVETLVRRIGENESAKLPFISKLVCISNCASLKNLVPSGVIDSRTVSTDLAVHFSSGGEVFSPIGGDEQIEIDAGELIYQDLRSGRVLCRGWNSRAGKEALISDATQDALMDIDGLLNVISRDELLTAAAEAASDLEFFCGARCSVNVLDSRSPSFELT